MPYHNFSQLPKKERQRDQHLSATGLSSEEAKKLVKAAQLLSHPWHGYHPTPMLHEFHKSDAKDRYLIAASQVGKTIGCARETWMYAGDCHPYRVIPRRAKFGIIAVGSLEGTAYDAVNRALYNTRPHHLIDWSRTTWNGRNFVGNYIFMRNGTIIRLVSSRGGSTGAAGVTADFIWIDEPPKRDKFSELLARRTQTDGHVWLSFTPYDSEQADLDWLRNYLEGDPDKNLPPESPGWGKYRIELNTTNCPWMSEKQVADIYAQTPLWVAEQRLKGAWETPPLDGYFTLDAHQHDWTSNLYGSDERTAGPWHWHVSVDHGELAAHQTAIFFGVRKRKGEIGPWEVEIKVVGEYVSSAKTTFEEDAVGLKRELANISDGLELPYLADPAVWTWTGDINTAGKGLAGLSANSALALALGIRKDAFLIPDKSPGSVENGLLHIRSALDARPSRLRLCTGMTGILGTPKLWRALRAHTGKADNTKHLVDALRYGVVPYLSMDPIALNRLHSPQIKPFERARMR